MFSDGPISATAPHVLGRYELYGTAIGKYEVLKYRKSSPGYEVFLVRTSVGIDKWKWMIGSVENIILEGPVSEEPFSPISGWSLRLPCASREQKIDPSIIVLATAGKMSLV